MAQIAELIGGDHRIGLTHALLASLGAQQAITTNYGNLFERACAKRGHPVKEALTVLPYGRVQENCPWLLKLHGSLDHGGRIVLTRSDYMSLVRERSALFGIVQALLVTKHLLFIGYSLRDEDFHQLVDEIRIAIGSASSRQGGPLGTVLMIQDLPWARLWDDLLHVSQIGKGPGRAGGTQSADLSRPRRPPCDSPSRVSSRQLVC